MAITRAQPDDVLMRARRLWHSARARAREKGLDFDITLEFVARRIAAGSCEATGLAFDLTPARRRATHPFTPTLDRADPAQGYTTTNTRVVAWAYNAARGTWGDDVLFLVAARRQRKLRRERQHIAHLAGL